MEKSKTQQSRKSQIFRILRGLLWLASIGSGILSLPIIYFGYTQWSHYWDARVLIPPTYPNSQLLIDGDDGGGSNCCGVRTWTYCTTASLAEVKIFYEPSVGYFDDIHSDEYGERYFAVISGESPHLNHYPPESAKPPLLDISIHEGHKDCIDGTWYSFRIVFIMD